MQLYPVPKSPEWHRINALPRRVWTKEQGVTLANQWTPMLLNPQGKAAWDRANLLLPAQRTALLAEHGKAGMPIELGWAQGLGISEFLAASGLFMVAPVGTGKTLLSLLIALVVERYFGVTRSVLFVKGSGEDQTYRDLEKLSRVWSTPRGMQIKTYELLAHVGRESMLDDLDAQCMIFDESDSLRREDAKTVKLLKLNWKRRPHTLGAFMTGTAARKSIKDVAHLFRFALKAGSPLPLDWRNLQEWAQAVDHTRAEDNPELNQYRRPPGAIAAWSDPGYADDSTGAGIAVVRRGLARRMIETPGVVVIDESSCDKPLHIRVLEAPMGVEMHAHWEEFRVHKRTPDGHSMPDPLTKWQYGTELSCDFYNRWDPRPPMWWIEARHAWNQHCNNRIEATARSANPLLSEGAVALDDKEHPTRLAWLDAQARFGKPNTVAVPLSNVLLLWIVDWLKVNGPAIVACQHTWLGRRLSAMTGAPYYEGQGQTLQGASIDDHPAGRSLIMSVHSNRRQRNLQHKFHRALIVGPECSAAYLEQLLGRFHRQGQPHPCYVDIAIRSSENLDAIRAAIGEADKNSDLFMIQQHKLRQAAWDWSHIGGHVYQPETIQGPARWAWL